MPDAPTPSLSVEQQSTEGEFTDEQRARMIRSRRLRELVFDADLDIPCLCGSCARVRVSG